MGALLTTVKECFPPATKFTVEDMPDLTGKVAIVTGGGSGVGKEITKALLTHNAKVYIATRNQKNAQQAIVELKGQTGKDALFLKLDLADLQSVKTAAEEFLSKEKDLHMLFNNAGVMVPPTDQVTVQGYDLQFGTNVLGHFYFTKLLLPALISGTKSSPDGTARVVTVSSSMSYFGGLNFNTFKDGPARRKCNKWILYGQSKFGNIVFAHELARLYGEQGIVSTSCNPGNLRSPLQRNLNIFEDLMIRPVQYDCSWGALTPLYAGTSTEGAKMNGKFLVPWARMGTPHVGTTNLETADALWKWLDEQVTDI